MVGDASQTIYSFAGATSDYLVRFADAYPTARVVRLEQNYRSTPDIIRAANLTMKGQPGALELQPQDDHTAPLVYCRHSSDDDEATWIAEKVGEYLAEGYHASDIAVLHRFSAQALLTEAALRSAGISVRTQGGTRFFDQPHVKRAVMEIRGAAVAHTPGPVPRVVSDILFGLGFTEDEPDHRGATRSEWEDLRAIMEMAERFGQAGSLAEFSEELVRRAQSHDEPTMPAVTLATVHSAKGQEWKVVGVVGLSVGQFPISYATTEEELAEERRLFYVAVTRAQERLMMSWSTHGQPGRGSPRTISPFLQELGLEA